MLTKFINNFNWKLDTSLYFFKTIFKSLLLIQFNNFENEAHKLLENSLVLPGYEMTLDAAHTFNLLDARGAISVTERAAYIGRIRNLSRAVAAAYYASREKLGFPMCAADDKHKPATATAAV